MSLIDDGKIWCKLVWFCIISQYVEITYSCLQLIMPLLMTGAVVCIKFNSNSLCECIEPNIMTSGTIFKRTEKQFKKKFLKAEPAELT